MPRAFPTSLLMAASALVLLLALPPAGAFVKRPDLAPHPAAHAPLPSYASRADPPPFPWYNYTLPVPERVAALVAALTLSEKAAQLNNAAPAVPRLALPAYDFWSEGLHGVAWAGRATVFPASIAMAASFSVDALHAVGQVIAREGRAKHNDYVKRTGASGTFFGLDFFAPNINIFRDPRWGRGQETYGEDPYLTGELAVALITGMQLTEEGGGSVPGVVATAKHFAAYNLESDYADGGHDGQYRLRFDANVSHTDLLQTYLPAFAAAITRAGVRSVMCSYNAVNGYPMCASPLLQSVLRDELHFDGYIVTDCGAVSFMTSEHHFTPNDTVAAALALKAGADLCCGDEYGHLVQAVAEGLVNLSDIDVALTRVLRQRFELGMFDPPARVPLANLTLADVDTPAARILARQVAEQGIVLLRNTGGLLPLTSSTTRVAVVGPLANRTSAMLGNYPGCSPCTSGDAQVDPSCTLVNPLDGLRSAATARNVTLEYTQGCDIDTNSTAGFAAALAAAGRADVVVAVMGIITCQEEGDQCIEAEAHDRVALGLPGQQLALLQALFNVTKRIVLVLVNGGPISEPWAARNIPAILDLWYAGEEAGSALANVLFGAVNPSGRMPVTVVESLGQLPDYLDLHMARYPGRTHRYLTQTPMYAFGYGLSYSRVAYSDLALAPALVDAAGTVTVTLQLTHVAGPDAVEVVQLYATLLDAPAPSANVSTPVQELKAFARVAVPQGGAAYPTLLLPVSSLALVGPDGSRAVLPGRYRLSVGGVSPGWQTPYTQDQDVAAPLVGEIEVTQST